MSELWDVYTIDRRPTGKTCIRGEQGKLAEMKYMHRLPSRNSSSTEFLLNNYSRKKNAGSRYRA